MAKLSKDRVREIIQNRPSGTSEGQVVDALIKNGHILEGFESPKEKSGIRKVGEFVGDVTGATGFGKAVFGAFRPASLKAVGKSLLGKEVPLEEIPETPTAKQALGSTAKLLTTVGAGVAKAPFLTARGLIQSGAIGAGFGAGEALEEKKDVSDVVKQAAMSAGLTAGITGGLGLAGKTVKPLSRAVSRFFFGPEGTTGFGVRFKDPQEVSKFLKTARRQPGGGQLEDITTLLNKSVAKVAESSGKKFAVAEAKLIQKNLPKSIQSESQNILKDFLKISKVTPEQIKTAGLSPTEVNVANRILREIKTLKKPNTRSVLNSKRTLSSLFRGDGSKTDALITRITKHLNKSIESVDPAFREASREFAQNKQFLDKVGFNLVGTSESNVDQTATKLFSLAKDLDNPFKKEGAEKLLVELGKRTRVDFLRILRALKTAENLSPQKAQGLRAGVIRELVRILQVGISEVAGFAGTQAQRLPQTRTPVELGRILLKAGTGIGVSK